MLTDLIESWNALYANHAALRTAIEFAHIGGLVAGGGCAIAADLARCAKTGRFPLRAVLLVAALAI
jgi:hypothetical protein